MLTCSISGGDDRVANAASMRRPTRLLVAYQGARARQLTRSWGGLPAHGVPDDGGTEVDQPERNSALDHGG
jgi:hypothetical protein